MSAVFPVIWSIFWFVSLDLYEQEMFFLKTEFQNSIQEVSIFAV